MRITFELLELMDETCCEDASQFVVVLIPTKETLFADYLRRNTQIQLRESLREVIEELMIHEEAAQKKLFEFLPSQDLL